MRAWQGKFPTADEALVACRRARDTLADGRRARQTCRFLSTDSPPYSQRTPQHRDSAAAMAPSSSPNKSGVLNQDEVTRATMRAIKRHPELASAVKVYGASAAMKLLCERLEGKRRGAQSSIRWSLDIEGKKKTGDRAQGLMDLALDLLKQETEETLEKHKHEKMLQDRRKQTEHAKRDAKEKKRKKQEQEQEQERQENELAELKKKRMELEIERTKKELEIERAAGSSEGDSESLSSPSPAKSSSPSPAKSSSPSPAKSSPSSPAKSSSSPPAKSSPSPRAQFASPVPSGAETGQQLTPYSWADAVRMECNKGPFRGATCRAAFAPPAYAPVALEAPPTSACRAGGTVLGA